MQSTFRNIVSDELKRVLGTSTHATQNGGNDTPPEAQDADMLWNYETMTARAPSELAEEDYVELMVAMERTLYDDLLAEMRAQGTTAFFSPNVPRWISPKFPSQAKNRSLLQKLIVDSSNLILKQYLLSKNLGYNNLFLLLPTLELRKWFISTPRDIATPLDVAT